MYRQAIHSFIPVFPLAQFRVEQQKLTDDPLRNVFDAEPLLDEHATPAEEDAAKLQANAKMPAAAQLAGGKKKPGDGPHVDDKRSDVRGQGGCN